MGLFVTTTGTSVAIPELGYTIVHPTTDFDVLAQFDADEVRGAASLTSAILAGTLIWRKVAAGTNQAASNYDPDFTDVERENTGTGNWLDRGTTYQNFFDSETVASTLNGTKTLTLTSHRIQYVTGTATGFKFDLPDATTLPISYDVMIYNQSSQNVEIRDAAGGTLLTVSQTSIAFGRLQLNSSAAGTWVWWQTFVGSASGIVNYNIAASTPFTTGSTTDVPITGFTFTPTAGRYAVWYNSDAQCTQNNSNIGHTIYYNGVAVADSIRRTQSVSSNFVFQQSTQTVVQADGVKAIDVEVKTSQGSLTVNGRSLLLIRLGG